MYVIYKLDLTSSAFNTHKITSSTRAYAYIHIHDYCIRQSSLNDLQPCKSASVLLHFIRINGLVNNTRYTCNSWFSSIIIMHVARSAQFFVLQLFLFCSKFYSAKHLYYILVLYIIYSIFRSFLPVHHLPAPGGSC